MQYENKGPTALTRAHEAAVDVPPASRDYVTALESELRFTKESLQATIEELETANEELQATNEELVASNEELQSTNEELHSVNEELYTVNVEHQRKITQLGETTDDLDNLLHSIDVGVMFLDDKLCIRKYTSQIATVFRLLPQDVGRRFDSFAPTIQHPDLDGDVKQVLENGQSDRARGLEPRRRPLPLAHPALSLDVAPARRGRHAHRHRRAQAQRGQRAPAVEHRRAVDGRHHQLRSGRARRELEPRRRASSTATPATRPSGANRRSSSPTSRRRSGRRRCGAYTSAIDVEPFETLVLRKDGSHVDVQLSLTALRNEHGEITGTSSIARDITQRKRDEQAIKRALKMREQFMAMLSHELRNPLSALLHASTLLKSTDAAAATSSGETPVQRRALEAIERQCKHMARLLDDLLDVSRMRQDGIELRREVLDLRGTVDAALERTRPLAQQAGVQLEVELPSEPVRVFGDPDRLQQIEVNLIANAIKYTPRGKRARLTLTAPDGHAELRIRDEGIGIPRDMLEQDLRAVRARGRRRRRGRHVAQRRHGPRAGHRALVRRRARRRGQGGQRRTGARQRVRGAAAAHQTLARGQSATAPA